MKMIIGVVCLAVCILSICTLGFSTPEDTKQQRILPKKVETDTNYDGKPDRTEYYNEKGEVIKVEVDNNGDAVIDETIIYEKGKPVKSERDTNKDGKPDMWIDF